MDHALRMGEAYRLADSEKQPEQIGEHRGTGVLIEPDAADQFHHIVDPPIGQPADIMNGHDSRMLEPSENTGFTPEPEGRIRTGGRRAQDFERHLSLQLAIASQKHRPHATLSQRANNFIAVAGQLRPLGHVAQVFQRRVRAPGHGDATRRAHGPPTGTPLHCRTTRPGAPVPAVGTLSGQRRGSWSPGSWGS